MSQPSIRFTQPQVASAKRPRNSLLTDGVKPQIHRLFMNKEQISAINALYDSKEVTNTLYSLEHDAGSSHLPSQMQARIFLGENHLPLSGVDPLKTRWRLIRSQTWGDGSGKRTKALYQCACGYSTQARQEVESLRKQKKIMKCNTHADAPTSVKSQGNTSTVSSHNTRPWRRHMAYDFKGCLVHADVTFCPEDQQVLRIMGFFTHNAECQNARITRYPPIRLHPQVYEIALQQLQSAFDLYAVKEINLQLFKHKVYKGMKDDPQFHNFRYLILRSDSSRIYRTLSQRQGINTREAPEVNIHNWLDASSRIYKPKRRPMRSIWMFGRKWTRYPGANRDKIRAINAFRSSPPSSRRI
ncbi:hypothetical protein FRC02_005997 [Tulasnella sp. 418]|nr:hypothetical protein FRC02_005997 [Tulasnella sp. 418]